MTIPPTPITSMALPASHEDFQTRQVVTIVGGHFVHDVYTAFVAQLLPLLIEKLSLSLTLAGTLTAMLQIPALLNPFVGYLADRVSLRYFVIFAPAVSATFVCLLGLAPSPAMMGLLLLLAGVSTAVFHAPAPAMIARLSGRQIGRGMGYFMAAGELGRSLGPLIVVWAVGMWGLDGFGRIVAAGWGMSAVLYWQLRDIPARPDRRTSLHEMLPAARRLFLPLFVFVFLRAFMLGSMTVFLPTLMSVEKGATFAQAGLTLTTYELPGVFGALASGAISERLGRTRTLVGATLLSSALMIAFLQTSGATAFLTLALLGFTSLMVAPVLLALVQEHMPHNRAVANGILLMLIFLSQPITSVLIGWIGDHFGLHAAFLFSAVAPLVAIPAILRLPKVEEDAAVPASSDTETLHS